MVKVAQKPRIYKTPESRKKAYQKKLQHVANRFRNKLLINQTPAEKRVEEILNKLQIEYKSQEVFVYSRGFFIVDFYLPEHNIVIELDGYHHTLPEKAKEDSYRDMILTTENGVKRVHRLLNKETECTTVVLKKKIIKLLND